MPAQSTAISALLAGDKRWFVAVSFTRAGGRVLAVFVLARLLGSAEFASFVLLASVEAIVGGLASATLCQPIVRVAPALAQQEQGALFGLTLRRAQAFSAICVVVLPVVIWIVSRGAIAPGLLAAFCASQAVGPITGAHQAVLTARFRTRRQFAASAGALGALAVTFGGLAALGAEAHAAYWWGVAVGAGVAWAIGLSAARESTPGVPKVASRDRLNTVRNAQAGSQAASVLAQRVQPFLLALGDGAGAVRLFGGASAILGPVRLAANTLVGVLEPRLARALRGPDSDRALWLVGALAVVMGVVGAGVVIVCALAEPGLARLALGGRFDDLGGALPWAAAGVTCEALGAILGVYVQLSHRRGPSAALRAQWAGTLVSLGMSWELGTRFGARGAMAGIAAGCAVHLAALCTELFVRSRERAGVPGAASMRGNLARGAERMAGEMVRAFPRAFRAAPANRLHVLCLHRCPERRLPEVLRLVELLGREHEIVPYGEAVRRLHAGAPRPTVALTFDDGTEDHLAVARALAERGVRACFFVCPGFVDVAGDRESEAKVCTERLHIPRTGMLGWEDVRAIQTMGHEVGCHSATHEDLGTLGEGDLDAQIAGARDRLADRGLVLRHFAWPFGRFARFSQDAARRVFEAGFESCASAERGWQAGGPGAGGRPCVRREVVGDDESAESVVNRLAFRAACRPVPGSGWAREWVEIIARA